ncbi:transglutaminase domain-containing protein [Aestuariivita sp.]|uniref:transglutaminase domain-containing protein n=1 Tax=Aestuariivita sp. TaxID=1872407 RepID=UPI002173080A|nr:transglutaminase domain-containing protein [Aestuariivita sp.]MCE8005916.1 transglutaminase domain-containing protein [Aestuariivita sp.]
MAQKIPPNAFAFYIAHSALSDPAGYGRQFDALPDAVAELCGVVQTLLIHDDFGAHLYGLAPEAFRNASRQTLPVPQRLGQLGPRPFSRTRASADRAIGTCRDFALLLCACLRHKGTPARVRCGFARYFHPPSSEDHWVCEYWHAAADRWAIADAQLDPEHRAHLCLTFDVTDIPPTEFVFPWQAWQLSRADPCKAQAFGHGETTGARFIHVNLARDLLALVKQETSDWDSWREMDEAEQPLSSALLSQGDYLAELSQKISDCDIIDAGLLDRVAQALPKPPWYG